MRQEDNNKKDNNIKTTNKDIEQEFIKYGKPVVLNENKTPRNRK